MKKVYFILLLCFLMTIIGCSEIQNPSDNTRQTESSSGTQNTSAASDVSEQLDTSEPDSSDIPVIALGYNVDDLYSETEQRFGLGELFLPLEETEAAGILEENGLEYLKESTTEQHESWNVSEPITMAGYDASLTLLIRVSNEPHVVEQLTVLIKTDDPSGVFEDITGQATEQFGKDRLTAIGEKTAFKWDAYSRHGIVSDSDTMPAMNEINEKWGEPSTLQISKVESQSMVVIVIS